MNLLRGMNKRPEIDVMPIGVAKLNAGIPAFTIAATVYQQYKGCPIFLLEINTFNKKSLAKAIKEYELINDVVYIINVNPVSVKLFQSALTKKFSTYTEKQVAAGVKNLVKIMKENNFATYLEDTLAHDHTVPMVYLNDAGKEMLEFMNQLPKSNNLDTAIKSTNISITSSLYKNADLKNNKDITSRVPFIIGDVAGFIGKNDLVNLSYNLPLDVNLDDTTFKETLNAKFSDAVIVSTAHVSLNAYPDYMYGMSEDELKLGLKCISDKDFNNEIERRFKELEALDFVNINNLCGFETQVTMMYVGNKAGQKAYKNICKYVKDFEAKKAASLKK